MESTRCLVCGRIEASIICSLCKAEKVAENPPRVSPECGFNFETELGKVMQAFYPKEAK